ncbi:MAG: hypothetical protein IT369_01315 [Candidatus Latescibacteria bacterium]|nr:hypothetical protein [Candidatus Latescibacterota bacterium]
MKRAMAGAALCWGLFIGAAGCGKLAMDSSWRTRQITVDGADSDWQGAVTYVAKGSTVVSLLNDEQFLYLRLASADRAIQAQMMRLGFTLWLDARGGEAQSFGIRFPRGMGGRGRPSENGEEGWEPEGGWQQRPEREPGKEPPVLAPGRPEIIGPGKGEGHALTDPDAEGIALEVVQAGGRLVYELKIPLARDEAHPYGLGVQPGQQFSIGFQTRTPVQGARRRGRGGEGAMEPGGLGRGDGGMGPEGPEMGGMEPPGMGMGGRGPGGRRGPGAGVDLPQPLKLWVEVRLASAPEAVSP